MGNDLQTSKWKHRIPYLVAVLHALWVIAFALHIHQLLASTGEVMLYWSFVFIADFPISLIVLMLTMLISPLIDSIQWGGDRLANAWYAMAFSTLGSLQYYWMTRKLFNKTR